MTEVTVAAKIQTEFERGKNPWEEEFKQELEAMDAVYKTSVVTTQPETTRRNAEKSVPLRVKPQTAAPPPEPEPQGPGSI